MTTLYFLIPVGLIMLGVGVAIFFWAVGDGQYEDLDTPGLSILASDDKRPEQSHE